MKLRNIYDFVVKEGIKQDPRGGAILKKRFKETRLKYRKLSSGERNSFDLEILNNPYADTRILFGDKDRNIKSLLVGIDIDVGEVLLADRLISSGKKIDLIISHHPQGAALAGLHEVMSLQLDLLIKRGLSQEVAKDFMEKRIKEVERRLSPANHYRSVDVARILGIPFMCIHTVSDNFVCSYLQNLLDRKRPKTLDEVMKTLRNIPEYKEAARRKTGPKILIGKPEQFPGRIFVDMTGGTEGSKELFGRLSQAGVGTIIGMHLSEEHFTKIKDEHINVIIAGHIASDSIGLNLLLDRLNSREQFEIIPCSGFMRIKR